MEFRRVSMAQFEEIRRLIESGITDRRIARTLKCRRSLVGKIREGRVTPEVIASAKKSSIRVPQWAAAIDWLVVEKDIRDGFELKRIWEEVASNCTSHSNFFKYIKTRFALLIQGTVSLRTFKPGEHCEVDYAGDKIEWVDKSTGEIHKAHVFLGALCFSQKVFAIAAEDEKKNNWLYSHRKMFEFFGGTPQVLVPDQLKNGVIKSHRYDPDLNPDYVELASHYNVAIVPARVRHPKDKAIVENKVGIVMRYFRFKYRRHTFYSLAEINRALMEVVSYINGRPHTRFKISRQERFETLEKPTLTPLPLEPYSVGQWRVASLHPDCTVAVDGNFYTAPHIYRGKEMRVKATESSVEIFYDLERLAVHQRERKKFGERIINPAHLPENSRAYHEMTPQWILSQSRFVHAGLYELINELFEQDTLGQLRRAQGLVAKARATIKTHGQTKAEPWITAAVAQMKRFNRIRVRAFDDFIRAEIKKIRAFQEDRTIERQPGNPMVRGHGRRPLSVINTNSHNQINLCNEGIKYDVVSN